MGLVSFEGPLLSGSRTRSMKLVQLHELRLLKQKREIRKNSSSKIKLNFSFQFLTIYGTATWVGFSCQDRVARGR